MKTNAIGSHAKRMEKGGRIILVCVFVYNKKTGEKMEHQSTLFLVRRRGRCGVMQKSFFSAK